LSFSSYGNNEKWIFNCISKAPLNLGFYRILDFSHQVQILMRKLTLKSLKI
jgi:hypothetical protein